jgi:AbrB family looped-hinge helix DNA binding protein
MPQTRSRLDRGGRVVIPAEYRRALGLRAGEEVILRLEDGEVRLLTLAEGIRRAQELVRRYLPEGRSLSDELIAGRKEQGERE